MTTITLPRAVVEQALQALVSENSLSAVAMQQRMDAITALRAALAQQAEPVEPVEPVGAAGLFTLAHLWAQQCYFKGLGRPCDIDSARGAFEQALKAYTAPPQRKPLTDEEIAAEWRKASECAGKSEGAVTTSQFVQMFARAVERAHGITDPQIEDRLARHGIPMPEGDPK